MHIHYCCAHLFQPASSAPAPAAAVTPAAEASFDTTASSNESTGDSQALVKAAADGDGNKAVVSDEREKLTFHIALGESGFASLGISVTKVFRNRIDCGVYIKSVRIGGMAAKV